MSTDIKIPTIGESIKEARILRWLKQDGEYVKAEEEKLDPATIAGTGRDGRITKEDALAAKEQPKPVPAKEIRPTETGPRETRQRMSSIRQRIAERLVQSQHTTATLTTFNEADM